MFDFEWCVTEKGRADHKLVSPKRPSVASGISVLGIINLLDSLIVQLLIGIYIIP